VEEEKNRIGRTTEKSALQKSPFFQTGPRLSMTIEGGGKTNKLSKQKQIDGGF